MKALQEAVRLADGGDLPSLLTTSPSVLVFESGISELMLEVAQVGADPLTVQDISASDEWIVEVSELDVDQAGLRNVPSGSRPNRRRNRASRWGLPVDPGFPCEQWRKLCGHRIHARWGRQVDRVTLASSSSRFSTPRGRARSSISSRPEREGTIRTRSPSSTPAFISWSAGTDNDNDGLLCDEGEACGAYATLSLPDAIRLGTADIADRDFLIGYRPDILTAQAAGAPSAIERMRLRP